MDWQALAQKEIQDFIKAHEHEDVASLALRKPPQGNWPYRLILDQIKSRQKSKAKLPFFYNAPGFILPPPDLIEQASSEACARFRASLFQGNHFADLTAGSGMDAFMLAGSFKTGICVEQDETHAALLKHNAAVLGIDNLETVQSGAREFLESNTQKFDLIYIDPQRRKGQQKGLNAFADGSPDIIALLPLIRRHAAKLVIKTSPMLDIAQAASALPGLRRVIVIERQSECKEVLYDIDLQNEGPAEDYIIMATALDAHGAVERSLEFSAAAERQAENMTGPPQEYLYEPGPAFLKSGAYKTLAARYGLAKLHPATHLYTGNTALPDFPGRGFRIETIIPADRKILQKHLPEGRANITIRNFPASPDHLRKTLKLEDGGDVTIFAATLAAGEKALILCRKIETKEASL